MNNSKKTGSEETEEEILTPPLNASPSPVYVPTFSPIEDSEDEALVEQSVTTHTTMEVKTIDALNSGDVNLMFSERDKMKLGGDTKRHPNRTGHKDRLK